MSVNILILVVVVVLRKGEAVKVAKRPRNFWCGLTCPKDTKHTMCAFEEKSATVYCWNTQNQMSPEKRELVLNWHNTLRDFVAGGGLGKKAANMRALAWDFEMEQVARRWVFQCLRSKDKCRTTEHYSHSNISQNIGWVTGIAGRTLPSTRTILENWNGTKVKFYDSATKKYQNYLRPKTTETLQNPLITMSKACLEKVGCGEVVYDQGQVHRRFLACNYAPSECNQETDSADVFNSQLFLEGTPCSKCPIATDCHFFYSGYKHLCQRHHGSNKKPVLRSPYDKDEGTINRISFSTAVGVIFLPFIILK